MLAAERSAFPPPTLFCLHYLSGSGREWKDVARQLAGRFRIVAIDLPGFGDAANQTGYSVGEMAQRVARTIAAENARQWMLVGHSMGAKVAAAIARSAEDGEHGLEGLVGLVAIAGSPPSPEPIPDADRASMLEWFGDDAERSIAQARHYIAQNSGPLLHDQSREQAVADVLRANRSAWQAWLRAGSREDWAQRVGVLRTPALIIAGADDTNLGPDAQKRLTAPHFAHLRSVTLPNAKHLLPGEYPEDIARLIEEHATSLGDAYRAIVASDRVSSRTRQALARRAEPDDPSYEPVTLDRKAFATLRAVVDRVVPQSGWGRIDLAARIDRELASGLGDGWRFADLPPDVQAYRLGLFTMNAASNIQYGHDFTELDEPARDAMLTHIATGSFEALAHAGQTPRTLTPKQMRAWFEDVRADVVKLYVAHPRTLERMGYSGIANGGDGMPKSGFVRVGIDDREAWEPVAATDLTT